MTTEQETAIKCAMADLVYLYNGLHTCHPDINQTIVELFSAFPELARDTLPATYDYITGISGGYVASVS